MGVDPLWRIYFATLLGRIYFCANLKCYFSAIAILGGWVWLGVDGGSFWSNMQAAVNFHEDVLNGMIKNCWCSHHMDCGISRLRYHPTAKGISRATTRTVVYSSLAILGLL